MKIHSWLFGLFLASISVSAFSQNDKTGKQTIDLIEYNFIGSFKDGLAKVAKFDEPNHPNDFIFGFIDPQGKLIIPLEYSTITEFKDGKAYANKTDKNGNIRMGMINTKGNIIIPFDYSVINYFEDGLSIVAKGCDQITDKLLDEKESKKCRFGVIDEQNRTVIPFEYSWLLPFQKGVAIAIKGKTLGKIDKTGKIVVPFTQATQKALEKEILSK